MFTTKGIYAEHMVLQQNKINCIFGTADCNKKVNLKFRDNDISTIADAEGNWKIEYNSGAAGGPFIFELTCENEEIIYKDIFVGEVWVTCGQSNAQLPMERMYFSYKEEFNNPKNDFIRMMTVPISYSFDGEKDSVLNAQWKVASPDTLGSLSGTGYFFAKKLWQELKVPVGIINASQGGSPVTSWMSEKALVELGKKEYVSKIERWNKPGEINAARDNVVSAQKKWDDKIWIRDLGISQSWEKLSFNELDSSWNEEVSIPGDIKVLNNQPGIIWLKKEIVISKQQAEKFSSTKTWLWLGTILDADKAWINGNECGVTYYTYPPRRYSVPAGTLKEGKNTITLRVQRNGNGPVRFYEEKPYVLFTDDEYIVPCSSKNVEVHKSEGVKDYKIELSGIWKCRIGCVIDSNRPDELFFEWEPSALYNSMLSPAFNYAISGAVWYQGESNAHIYEEYGELLSKMIENWRNKFIYADKNMPVIIMQLPNWADGYKDESKHNFGNWPELRYQQRKAAEECGNCGIVNLIDAGEWNDLHPEKKYTGGTRAALEALRIAYKKDISAAPVCAYCQNEGKSLSVRFECGKSELCAFSVNESTGATDFSKPCKEVYGFEFKLLDGSVVPAKAVLVSNVDVVISIPEKRFELSELRYLWNNNPWKVNLYSSEGLPAMAFKIKIDNGVWSK